MITITFARKKSGSHFPLQLVVIARVSSFTSKEEKKKRTQRQRWKNRVVPSLRALWRLLRV